MTQIVKFLDKRSLPLTLIASDKEDILLLPKSPPLSESTFQVNGNAKSQHRKARPQQKKNISSC
jgi:hypothetical protein